MRTEKEIPSETATLQDTQTTTNVEVDEKQTVEVALPAIPDGGAAAWTTVRMLLQPPPPALTLIRPLNAGRRGVSVNRPTRSLSPYLSIFSWLVLFCTFGSVDTCALSTLSMLSDGLP